jgi:nicotinate-nucleotide pyrophosphorylase
MCMLDNCSTHRKQMAIRFAVVKSDAKTPVLDIVLLDNINLDNIRHGIPFEASDERSAIEAASQWRGPPCLRLPHDVSGTVTLATIGDIAITGVDLISVSELTHKSTLPI